MELNCKHIHKERNGKQVKLPYGTNWSWYEIFMVRNGFCDGIKWIVGICYGMNCLLFVTVHQQWYQSMCTQ